MQKICGKFVPRVIWENQKEIRCHDSREMVELINSNPAGSCSGYPRWKLDLLLWPRDQETGFWVKACWLSQTQWRSDISNPPTIIWWSLFFLTALAWSKCTGFPLDRQSTRNTMLRFQGSSGEIPSEEASTLQIGWTAFPPGQCTSPQLKQFWPRWASRQFLSFLLVQTLISVTFGHSLSSRKNLEAVVMRKLKRWKRLWRRSLTRSHKRTSMGLSRSCWNGTRSALQPEAITSKGTRVSCVYYQ